MKNNIYIWIICIIMLSSLTYAKLSTTSIVEPINTTKIFLIAPQDVSIEGLPVVVTIHGGGLLTPRSIGGIVHDNIIEIYMPHGHWLLDILVLNDSKPFLRGGIEIDIPTKRNINVYLEKTKELEIVLIHNNYSISKGVGITIYCSDRVVYRGYTSNESLRVLLPFENCRIEATSPKLFGSLNIDSSTTGRVFITLSERSNTTRAEKWVYVLGSIIFLGFLAWWIIHGHKR